MSHFSKIKTRICNFTILQKTLKDLGFEYCTSQQSLRDSYSRSQHVDLLIKNKSKNLLGFQWDGNEYNLIADLQLWDQSLSIGSFMDQIVQQYAVNSILDESLQNGFNSINQSVTKDGSIKLVVQRWH